MVDLDVGTYVATSNGNGTVVDLVEDYGNVSVLVDLEDFGTEEWFDAADVTVLV